MQQFVEGLDSALFPPTGSRKNLGDNGAEEEKIKKLRKWRVQRQTGDFCCYFFLFAFLLLGKSKSIIFACPTRSKTSTKNYRPWKRKSLIS